MSSFKIMWLMLMFDLPTKSKKDKKRIKDFINKNIKNGNIRILTFTDKQFSNMDVIIGEKSIEEKNEPVQLLLF